MTSDSTNSADTETYDYRYSDEAVDDLVRLGRADRKTYNEALAVRDEVCAAPHDEGYPLTGEWEGCRAKHFGSDRYRFVWECIDDVRCVAVLRVGKRNPRGISVYEAGRPESPIPRPGI